MRTRIVTFVLLCAVAGAVPAEGTRKIYKWVLPDGSITYSDQPQVEGAKEVELPPLQLYKAPPSSAASSADARKDETKPEAVKYDSVKVAQPTPDETVRDNSGTVSVRIDLRPGLQAGHTIEILLDGKPIGSGAATSVSVTNVDRGTHTVSAVVKDESGQPVASAPAVTFHLKRAAKPRPAPAG